MKHTKNETSPEEKSIRGLELHKGADKSGVILMECRGNLIAETAGDLKAQVKGLIPHEKKIILDLAGVTRMDSSGLGTIVGLYVSARKSNCELKLINLTRPIRDLLGLTHLLSVFEDVGKHGARLT